MTDRNKSENLRANMLSTEDSIGLGKSIENLKELNHLDFSLSKYIFLLVNFCEITV